ncbi:hypothetical protein CEY16_06215 [Halalkalibacillus sediminis]|uniref:DAGKc domain-containing protein n=1 Tax=Halalkalibacillus sediminis TaxID=2018042 RepID=A0A2I0QYC8_9BACI|nr:diacylglycerol kinase family protein [Halalkalibacillus sediminis]PKR79333.1 hypothetical protein CEY16_06215 [Halalkalibacillus sediminis]
MYVMIINPKAGNYKSQEVLESFLSDYPQYKNKCKTFYSEYPGHAEKLAQQVGSFYHQQIEMLFIFGGDGTLYEVMNGIKAFPDIPVSFVPTGSGNDFARGCKTPLDAYEQLRASLKYKGLKPYWFGVYQTDFKNPSNQRLFSTCLGFGFDAEVAERANRSFLKKWFNRMRLKSLIYVFGLIATLFIYRPKRLSLNINGEKKEFDDLWMLTVSNHPYFGGGMKIAPEATINSDEFTVTVVQKISKWKLLLLFSTVFKGKHTKLKEVHTFKASTIELFSSEQLTYQADGFTGKCYKCKVSKESKERMVVRN